jgi:hypothetical protein
MNASPPSSTLKTRQVYYIAGFDRRGPAYYHRMYVQQAHLQAKVNGWQIEVGPKQADGPMAVSWSIKTRVSPDDPEVVSTRYTFLRWEELVKSHWPNASRVAFARMLPLCWTYVFAGGFGRLWRHGKRLFASVLAPFLVPVVGGLLSALLGLGLAYSGVAAWFMAHWMPASVPPVVWNGLLGVGVAVFLLRKLWSWCEDRRLFWLARAWHFAHIWAEDVDPAIQAKWEALGDVLYERWLQSDADEQLIVAHCGGVPAAMGVLAHAQGRLSKAGNPHADRCARTRLLTLSQMLQMMLFFPGAARLHAQVRAVAKGPWAWFNLAAPQDPLCCGLTDPTTGVQGLDHRVQKPQTRSARFDRMLSKSAYQALLRDGFDVHFQYLMASEYPVVNDYFSITAGPMGLPQRWAQFP